MVMFSKHSDNQNLPCKYCGINLSLVPAKYSVVLGGEKACVRCAETISNGRIPRHCNGKEKELNTLGPSWISKEELQRICDLPCVPLVRLFEDFSGDIEDDLSVILKCHYDCEKDVIWFIMEECYFSQWWSDHVFGARDLTLGEFIDLVHLNDITYFDGMTEENWREYILIK